jgi:hypothetical protein
LEQKTDNAGGRNSSNRNKYETPSGVPVLDNNFSSSYLIHHDHINFETLFNSIAPYLNENNSIYLNDPSLCMNILSTSFNSENATQKNIYTNSSNYNLIYNSNLIPLLDNFYLSNVISKSSVTMGKCSSQFATNSL